MKRLSKSHHAGRLGVHAIGTKISKEFGWLFREQAEDFGIDAHIEVVANGEPTGKIIAVQIKSGESYFVNEEAPELVFRGDPKHLKYWLEHDLPVLVILYHPKIDTAYWQVVTEENITRTPKGWKMFIPQHQKIEATQTARLEEMAISRARSEARQLNEELQEYRCPFCRAPLAERGGAWVGTEHYGLHEVFDCGYHTLDSCVESPCPSDPKFPRFEDYDLQFHPASASGNLWVCIALPKTEMARKLSLGAASGSTEEVAKERLRETYDRHARRRK